jgi:predicted NBD/HSP70 family sugar kinase
MFKKIENTINVLFNDGVSSGLIIDGKLAKGCYCAAGSLHQTIVDSKQGKLEDYAAPSSIEKLYKQKQKIEINK